MSLEKETSQILLGFYKDLALCSNLPFSTVEKVEFVMNPNGDWPNYLLEGEHITREVMDAILDEMNAGRCPSFWIRRIKTDGFDSISREKGLRQIIGWHGMELFKDNEFSKTPPLRNVKTERIVGEKELQDWARVVNAEVLSGKEMDFSIFRNVLHDPNFEFFRIAYMKKTVTTLLVYQKEGIAGLYMLSTVPEMRGNGLAGWIITEAMDYFIRKGIVNFVLHATNASYPLLMKIGFIKNSEFGIYWKVGMF